MSILKKEIANRRPKLEFFFERPREMIQMHDIRYLRLGTQDLGLAKRYVTKVLGLEIARKIVKTVHFHSSSHDHTLMYFECDPQNRATGCELDVGAEVDAARTLENADYNAYAGSRDECEQHYLDTALSFIDQNGNRIGSCPSTAHIG